MKFPASPSARVPEKARFATLLTLFLALAPAAARANETPKPAARPVARLVSSSSPVVPERVRERLESETRAVPAPVASASPASNERRLFDMINRERRSRGMSPLVWDSSLTRMARYHSESMARGTFLSHTDRDGLDLSGRARLLGLHGWKAIAENIAYNQGFDDPEAFALERWMVSAMHRENILNGNFTHAGLAIARSSDGRVYFTQVFMKR
jgi:uncharacterized protein YkwD